MVQIEHIRVRYVIQCGSCPSGALITESYWHLEVAASTIFRVIGAIFLAVAALRGESASMYLVENGTCITSRISPNQAVSLCDQA